MAAEFGWSLPNRWRQLIDPNRRRDGLGPPWIREDCVRPASTPRFSGRSSRAELVSPVPSHLAAVSTSRHHRGTRPRRLRRYEYRDRVSRGWAGPSADQSRTNSVFTPAAGADVPEESGPRQGGVLARFFPERQANELTAAFLARGALEQSHRGRPGRCRAVHQHMSRYHGFSAAATPPLNNECAAPRLPTRGIAAGTTEHQHSRTHAAPAQRRPAEPPRRWSPRAGVRKFLNET